MSKITLSGNVSGTGTLTIAAPNTNTDYTLTLPTNTGTVLTDSNSSQAGTFSTLTVNGNNISADNSLGFRNRIINGDMRIDQRNAGAAINNATSAPFSVDRWMIYGTSDSKYSAQRSTTAPSGFVNSLLLTSLAATSVGTSDRYVIWQKIEGNNMPDFAWGTASAKTVTLSFWARSSVTGNYGGCIVNSAGNRSYPFTYSISAANTFEYKTITITGDTSGTWLTDSGIGMYMELAFGAGSTFSGTAGAWAGANYSSATGATNWISTNGATFYITGVQLEVGSVATPFERRPYGTELALCQRYYCKTFSTETAPAQNTGYTGALGAISVNAGTATALWVHWQFPVEMRAVPTITTFSPAAANSNWYSPAGPSSTTTAGTFAGSTRFQNIYNTNAPAVGADVVYYIQATASIEL